MDQQSKSIVLGVLGLTTVVVFCAYAVSRRKATARADSAKRDQPSPQLDAGATKEEAVVAISPALEENSPALKDKTLSAAVAGVAAAAEAAAVAGYDADAEKEKEKERQREAEVAAAMQAPSQLFNRASANAKKYFREGRFSEAAEQYGIALSHCDNLENRKSQRTALHNNRGAAFEKAGKYAQALSECVLCLTREPEHPLARVRKSRVLEALGRPVDALAEVCAHLLLERDRFQAKIAMNPLMQPTPPPPPQNLEALLQKIANSRADEILAEREKADAGETERDGKGAQGNASFKRKPLMKQAVSELLRSFGSYTELERRCKNMDKAGVTRELQESVGEGEGGDGSSASPGSPATASRVSSLVDRGLIRLVKCDYDGAREDIFEAARMMSDLQKGSTGEEIGVPADVEASLWEWQGTFHQLELDADAAMEAYQRCEGRLKADGGREPKADVLIKMAWVHIDKDDNDKAKAVFDRAIDLYPDYGSNYAHRARLREGAGDGAVVALLDKALQLNQKDVYAREQLCKLYEEAGAIDKAIVAAQSGIDAVPNSEALLTLKAGLEFALAVKNQDMSAASRIGDLFDEAIRVAPASTMAYVNKAMFLLQMMNDVPGAVETMQKGVDADPTSVSALVQLANLKVMMARTTEDGEVSVNLLETAVAMCVTREELLETLSVLVATEGRIQAAVLLGRTSLA